MSREYRDVMLYELRNRQGIERILIVSTLKNKTTGAKNAMVWSYSQVGANLLTWVPEIAQLRAVSNILVARKDVLLTFIDHGCALNTSKRVVFFFVLRHHSYFGCKPHILTGYSSLGKPLCSSVLTTFNPASSKIPSNFSFVLVTELSVSSKMSCPSG